MHPKFAKTIEQLHPAFENLMAIEPCTPLSLPDNMPLAGIYLFTENGRHLYVGRSNRIRKRLGNHCRPGATHRMAAFAVRLAREATGKVKATYNTDGSLADLMRDAAFVQAFETAKARIRKMDVRFVEEKDPVCQTILEVYVAVVLQTPYNDFNTH